MAESVKVIDPNEGTGWDYHSLFDWEAAQQADIDTPGTIAVANADARAEQPTPYPSQ